MMLTTAILVSVLFAPELEGAQVAALLWTTFGIGVAVTSPVAVTGAGARPAPRAPVSPGGDPQPQREIGRRPADPDGEHPGGQDPAAGRLVVAGEGPGRHGEPGPHLLAG